MPIQDVVWDMDGTLLDSTGVVPDAFIRSVRRLGGPSLEPIAVIEAYSVGVPEAILAHLMQRELEEGEGEVYYEELATVSVAAYPGVPEVLDELRQRSRAIAVFTGASVRAAQMLLSAGAITADIIVGGDQITRPKPAGDGLVVAARLLGRSPAEIAYVGDAPTDLRAARAAGSAAVAAAWGHLYRPEEPCDFVVHRPHEVLDLVMG